MLIEDRSSMEADWRCGMERYWLTEYREPGRSQSAVGGLVPVKSVYDLELGSAFADGIAAMAAHENELCHAGDLLLRVYRDTAEMIAQPFEANWGKEKASLLRGLLFGAATHILPRLRQDYDLLKIEGETFLTFHGPQGRGELLFMVRPDLVFRRRSDGTVWVPDWKTSSWKDVEWLLKWPWAIQLHLQAAAVRQTDPHLDVQGSIILGAYKGFRRDPASPDAGPGEVSSPFTYIYNNGGVGTLEWSPKWLRGWNKVPAWEYPNDGIYGWVLHMRRQWPSVLSEQFPTSQPIMLNEEMVATVGAERISRMKRIAAFRRLSPDGREKMRSYFFDHRTLNCARCPYQPACWSPTIGLNPLGSGLFVPRVPNHELERTIWLQERKA
jgi:hypothetical protein